MSQPWHSGWVGGFIGSGGKMFARIFFCLALVVSACCAYWFMEATFTSLVKGSPLDEELQSSFWIFLPQ